MTKTIAKFEGEKFVSRVVPQVDQFVGEIKKRLPVYIVADLHDLEKKNYWTLAKVKDFLQGMWINHEPSEDEDFDAEKMCDDIMNSDFEELERRLQGIDHTIFKTEDEYEEFKKVWKKEEDKTGE